MISVPLPRKFIPGQGDDSRAKSGLFDNNGAFFTNFNATFAAETFFSIDRNGFAILHLEYFDRTHIHAFFTTSALFFIDDRIKSHYQTLLSIDYFEMVLVPFNKVVSNSCTREVSLYQLEYRVKPCWHFFLINPPLN